MLKILKLKMDIKTINWSLFAKMMKSYYKSIKSFGLKLKTFWDIKWNVLPVYDDRYMKTKIRTYEDIVHTNFHELNVAENGVKCKSFTIISIEF